MGKNMRLFGTHGYSVAFAGTLAALAFGGVCMMGGPAATAQADMTSSGLGGIAAAQGAASPLAGIGDGKASPIASFEDEDVLLATYSNAAQGFSLLVDAGSFTVTEGQGAGATFVLNADASSYFAVSYVADWEGTPDVGEYLEEQLWHGQMEHSDSYVQVSADGGEVIYLAGVGAYACAYGYVDSSTGQNMTVIQAMEPRSDGSVVYWTLCTSDESAEQVATALVWASATFRVGADAYAGSNMWCEPSDLVQRPSGSTYSLVDDAVNTTATPAPATSADTAVPTPAASADAAVPAPAQPAPAQASATAGTYQLVDYDGGHFTVALPQGWSIQISGEGAGFTFEAFDPANPAVRIVYYGELAFNLNEQMRELFALSASSGDATLDQLYTLYANLPVLDPCTVANAVSLLPAYTQLTLDLGGVDDGTGLMVSSAQVTSSVPVSYYSAFPGMAGYVRDDALVSAELTLLDGTACRADFLGSVIALGYEGGYGMAAAMGMWGIIAPADMYDDVVAQLAPCVGTLTFSDEYVAQCNAANDAIAAAALDRSAANNAVMDQALQDFDDYIMDRDRFTFSDGSQLVIQR